MKTTKTSLKLPINKLYDKPKKVNVKIVSEKEWDVLIDNFNMKCHINNFDKITKKNGK